MHGPSRAGLPDNRRMSLIAPQHWKPQSLLRASIVVAVLTIGLKTLAWWITASVGLLADAMESFVNLASAGFALLMVTIAHRPADADHPYGHHKAEYFSSGFEGLLIIVAALGIVWASVQRLLVPQPLDQLGLGSGTFGLSSRLQWRAGMGDAAVGPPAPIDRARRRRAPPDHRCMDFGRRRGRGALVHVTGWQWLDPAVAIAVALNILREGAR